MTLRLPTTFRIRAWFCTPVVALPANEELVPEKFGSFGACDGTVMPDYAQLKTPAKVLASRLSAKVGPGTHLSGNPVYQDLSVDLSPKVLGGDYLQLVLKIETSSFGEVVSSSLHRANVWGRLFPSSQVLPRGPRFGG